MKLLHQAEPTHSNFDVNGWTIQWSGPGWISNACPAAVRLNSALRKNTTRDALPGLGRASLLGDLSPRKKDKIVALLNPATAQLHSAFPATATPKSDGGGIPFATPWFLLSFQQEVSFKGWWRGVPGVTLLVWWWEVIQQHQQSW